MSNRKEKMPEYTTTGNTFVNPYNFVSLERECYKFINYEDRKKAGNLTGWIDCSIETLAPIFIPNTTSVQEDKEGKNYSDVFEKIVKDKDKDKDKLMNSYDFYSYTNLKGVKQPEKPKPVIPGSEIRGMIRSAFETVTNSCLSTIDDEQKLYKRVTSPAKPGRLIFKDNEWKIIKCEKYKLPKKWVKIEKKVILINNEKYSEADSVFVSTKRIKYENLITEISKKPKQGFKEGYLHIGGEYKDKKYESVFIPTDENIIPIDETVVCNLIDNLKLYQDKTINLNFKKGEHNGYKHIGDAGKLKLNNMNNALVYYAQKNGKYYLSPAAIGREVFYNKLTDIIGTFKPCEKIAELCQTCALFGLAGNESAASRVRFTDALSDKYEYYESNTFTLKELASPKLSATEFYLKKPKQAPDLWNYDYAGNWNRQNDKVGNKWENERIYQPEIRGRKFYWHHKNPNPFLKDETQASERNVHIRPLKKGAIFTFRIYFNDISDEELNKLLWVLEIGGKKENAHKIGMGKPIGMGSIKIDVTSVKTRLIQIKDGTVKYAIEEYKKPSYTDIEAKLINPDILKEFLTITDFKNAPDNVKYPCNDDSDKVYEWFVANKRIKGTGTSPVISQTLPDIKNPFIKSYISQGKKKTF